MIGEGRVSRGMPGPVAVACAALVFGAASGVAMGADVDELWLYRLHKTSPAERTLVVTLQGLVAKDRPRIWVEYGGMYARILDELRAEGTRVHEGMSAWELLAKFRRHVKGMIVYKGGTDSINVATSLCGPRRAVAVEESILERAKAEGLRVLFDARGYDEVRAFEEFSHLFDRGVMLEQAEKKHFHLRDFAVLHDAFTCFGVKPEERTRFVRELGPGTLVYGFGDHEERWVKEISAGGGTGIPADWSMNLSFLPSLRVPIPERPRRRPAPVKRGERIVTFVMSDGDNIQWVGGPFVNSRGHWASKHRGSFDMSWEMAPILADVAPRVLRHFYREASKGAAIDDFIVGPSGIGYSFHNHLPDRSAFAEATAGAMRRSRLSITTMLNSGGDMTQSRELLERPEVMGVLYKDYAPYNKRKGEIYWHAGKPCVSYRYLLWEPRPDKSPEGVARAIAQQPALPATDENSYAAVNVHAWSFKKIGGPMEAVKRTIDLLPPRTRVVTAEEFFVLLRANFGTPVPR